MDKESFLKHPLTLIFSFFVLLFVYSKIGPQIPFSLISSEKGQPLVVEGTGKATTVPDIAKLMVGIEDTGASLKAVQNSVNSKSKNLTDALRKLGIGDKDIKTTSYNIFPETGPVIMPMPAVMPVPFSPVQRYRVSTTYEITIRDFDKVENTITAATGAGANIVSGVSFDVNEETKNKKMGEARVEAVKEARQKAESLAAASGVTLGKLINISESNMPRLFPLEARGGMGGTEQVKPNIQPGETEFTVVVTLTYEIR